MSAPRRRRKDQEPLNQVVGTLATVPTATGEIPNPVESLARNPTHDEIARRAYQLYEERGRGAWPRLEGLVRGGTRSATAQAS